MIIFVKNTTMEKTAIEWLIEQFESYDSYQIKLFHNEINTAKEMEKQQIIDAHIDGVLHDSKTNGYSIKIAENYYKDTFSN
jgi:hypothetical protein